MELQFNADGSPFVMWGGNKIQLENGPVTDKIYLEKAEKELRETPEIVKAALEELRKLLKGESNLAIPINKDEFLMKFLRPCKFYAESAFKRIQAYYKFRRSHPEHCHDLMPSAVRPAFDESIVSILSPRDQHGRRIMVVESGERWNPRKVSLTEVFRGVQLGLEAAMDEPLTQVNGVISILDMKGLSLTQVMQFTPSFAKMVIDWIQDCVPIRLKAVHIVNQPYVFNMLFAIFKPFMREKLRSRIHFHGTNFESLLSHIDAKATRKRHGGALPEPEIPGEVLWKMLQYYEEDFKVANSYGYTNNNNHKK
ncbi:alpha-tocopherol transfer protein-like isoform X1 [Amyelois transitella]|uniref:alpha-tocopherol transfer protein-like isoform X1 n=1 Tax=Amyelois transitella TaxID=680683 RepID=UPI0029903149|nr:alpha-tocopherol transfer protein-like isoform X1 [Amyelois transitella]